MTRLVTALQALVIAGEQALPLLNPASLERHQLEQAMSVARMALTDGGTIQLDPLTIHAIGRQLADMLRRDK